MNSGSDYTIVLSATTIKLYPLMKRPFRCVMWTVHCTTREIMCKSITTSLRYYGLYSVQREVNRYWNIFLKVRGTANFKTSDGFNNLNPRLQCLRRVTSRCLPAKPSLTKYNRWTRLRTSSRGFRTKKTSLHTSSA